MIKEILVNTQRKQEPANDEASLKGYESHQMPSFQHSTEFPSLASQERSTYK